MRDPIHRRNGSAPRIADLAPRPGFYLYHTRNPAERQATFGLSSRAAPVGPGTTCFPGRKRPKM